VLETAVKQLLSKPAEVVEDWPQEIDEEPEENLEELPTPEPNLPYEDSSEHISGVLKCLRAQKDNIPTI
jgi:hypothetical protein